MEYMESKMQDQIEGAQNEYERMANRIAELERMVGMLRDTCRKISLLENTEDDEWDCVERVVPEMADLARVAIKDTQQTALDYENRIKAEALREAAKLAVEKDFTCDSVCNRYVVEELTRMADELERKS